MFILELKKKKSLSEPLETSKQQTVMNLLDLDTAYLNPLIMLFALISNH